MDGPWRAVHTRRHRARLRGYLACMRVHVEVCVTTMAEALAAASAGADSVELCTDLPGGGVTPGIGLAAVVREALDIPVRVLVRPRPGDFHYDGHDRAAIISEARWLVRLDPAARIVTGALTHTGLPDGELMKALRAEGPGMEITFHRAIDHAADLPAALDACLGLGLQRVLTSGGASRAMEGCSMLAALVKQAGKGVRVAAAGGIRPAEVVELVERTEVREVHFAAQRQVPVDGAGLASLSSARDTNATMTVPDVAKMEAMLEALDKAGLR